MQVYEGKEKIKPRKTYRKDYDGVWNGYIRCEKKVLGGIAPQSICTNCDKKESVSNDKA